MKTIFRILACYLAVSLILPSVTAEENQHTIDEAEYALQEFMSQSGWNDYVVEDYYVLYDADIEEYGYIFKLSNDSFLGYAIAVEAPNGYHIAEASKNCVFPYDGYEDEYLLIYTTSFGYYAISDTMVGYSVITYSGTPANYVIVRDPGTSGVPELYLSWNSTNIHGYYLIYVG
ncbi:MAG: hypothetical protein HUJ57_07655 [Erysipelotrichaceae bacterium]|nr:hypothetical protein [Erysipelotrichaceae bacterium]